MRLPRVLQFNAQNLGHRTRLRREFATRDEIAAKNALHRLLHDLGEGENARAGHPLQLSSYGHFTIGGSEERIASTLPPVFSPKIVPRS